MGAFWEAAWFQEVAGSAWRPGGTQLTASALTWLDEQGLLPDKGLALDFGCGAGASLALLSSRNLRALGLDLRSDPKVRELLSETVGVLRADIVAPPLVPRSADLLLAECVLSLVADPRAVLCRAYELLKRGACCLVADLTTRAILPSCATGTSCLAGARPAETWRTLLTEAGFRLLREENHDRELRAFAARLVWYADNPPACFGAKLAHGLGYGLWLAQKP